MPWMQRRWSFKIWYWRYWNEKRRLELSSVSSSMLLRGFVVIKILFLLFSVTMLLVICIWPFYTTFGTYSYFLFKYNVTWPFISTVKAIKDELQPVLAANIWLYLTPNKFSSKFHNIFFILNFLYAVMTNLNAVMT